jgi:hypothetical protein
VLVIITLPTVIFGRSSAVDQRIGEGITMRATLRRAVTLAVAAVALALGVAIVSSAPAVAGTNWDGVVSVNP